MEEKKEDIQERTLREMLTIYKGFGDRQKSEIPYYVSILLCHYDQKKPIDQYFTINIIEKAKKEKKERKNVGKNKKETKIVENQMEKPEKNNRTVFLTIFPHDKAIEELLLSEDQAAYKAWFGCEQSVLTKGYDEEQTWREIFSFVGDPLPEFLFAIVFFYS